MDDDFDPQRATKVAAVASMGTLLALVSVFAGGGHASGAATAAAGAATVGTSPATPAPVLTIAPAVQPVVAASVVTTTTELATTTTARACTTTYTVQRGDFWLLLAGEASVPVDQLYAANGAGPSTSLFPGETICLPDGTSVVTTTSTAPPVTAARPATTVARKAAPVVTAAQSTHSSK